MTYVIGIMLFLLPVIFGYFIFGITEYAGYAGGVFIGFLIVTVIFIREERRN